MKAYRIARRPYPVFDSRGAADHGGRWNSPGHAVIYAAGTYALACLELLAHAGLGRPPPGMRYLEIDIPDSLPKEALDARDLPDWDATDCAASRAYGDAWRAAGRTAVLLVPSVLSPFEVNVVLNPAHPDFPGIAAGPELPLVLNRRIARLLGRKTQH